jgi:FkbM family methyltransferase
MNRIDSFFSYLYREVNLNPLPSGIGPKLMRRFYGKLWREILKRFDPKVQIKISESLLWLPGSSHLPMIKTPESWYDTALTRLGQFIKNQKGALVLIDVGANVGDSVSFVAEKVQGQFLCIEADAQYFKYLQMNAQKIPGVICENVALSDKAETHQGAMVAVGGTAHIRTDAMDQKTFAFKTLDQLTEKHVLFKQAHILKIDTDGYDYKVLRGAMALLQNRPILYFELSPWHLRHVGHEDPLSIFYFLKAQGYSQYFFYDNGGYPLLVTEDLNTCKDLIHYAEIKGNTFYDVLVFHDSEQTAFAEFRNLEFALFPKKSWE